VFLSDFDINRIREIHVLFRRFTPLSPLSVLSGECDTADRTNTCAKYGILSTGIYNSLYLSDSGRPLLLTPIMQNLTFVGPYIVIYFYSKTNHTHNISSLFYFGTTLHVSEGLSVHHQESKAVHTTSGICHSGSVAACC